MRLTILGGSAAGANPGQGCSGYLVRAGRTTLVADLGPGTFIELRKHTDFRDLDGIVISHLHVDHLADLLAMRFALAYNPVRRERNVPLFVPPGGLTFLRRLGAAVVGHEDDGAFFAATFTIVEYDPAATLTVGDLRIAFTPTVHFIPCWAMRIATEAARDGDLTYTADTGPAADLAEFAAGSRVLLAEATYLSPTDAAPAERGHLTAAEAGVIATSAGVTTLVLTHLWEELGIERLLESAKSTFDGEIKVARPGLSLEW